MPLMKPLGGTAHTLSIGRPIARDGSGRLPLSMIVFGPDEFFDIEQYHLAADEPASLRRWVMARREVDFLSAACERKWRLCWLADGDIGLHAIEFGSEQWMFVLPENMLRKALLVYGRMQRANAVAAA